MILHPFSGGRVEKNSLATRAAREEKRKKRKKRRGEGCLFLVFWVFFGFVENSLSYSEVWWKWLRESEVTINFSKEMLQTKKYNQKQNKTKQNKTKPKKKKKKPKTKNKKK